jgi:predicted ATPase/transcriptional regulator with XRE-family HTH domain
MSSTELRGTSRRYQAYELLYMFRSRSGLTQSELATLIGLKSFRMIQYWEGGYSLPKAEKLRRMIEVFCQENGFLNGSELEEARLLWETIKSAAEARPDSYSLYPVFDKVWLDQFLQRRKTSEIPAAEIPAETIETVENKLPQPLNGFVGRENELKALTELLSASQTRLLTLTGAGGTGKTRLAIELAQQLQPNFRDGCYFVGLAMVRSAEGVIPAVARSLNLPEAALHADLVDSLKSYLRKRQILLVLDNFEHLPAAADVLPELIQGALELKIVVTSREILRIYGERQFELKPLAEAEAVSLFVQRARLVQPDFELSAANASAVSEICRKLDRLPLAIELAAARSRVFTPSTLLKRLNDPLKLLAGSAAPYAPDHHKTLRDTIEWSYRLLTEREQTLFRRLAVFTGGLSLAALETVCRELGWDDEAAAELASGLVDKSILQRVMLTGADDSRFIMLETLREYGIERLVGASELGMAQEQHARYFLGLAGEASRGLQTGKQVEWLARLEIEHSNLLAAFDYLSDLERVLGAMELAGALWRFWWVKGYLGEGRYRLEWVRRLAQEAELTAHANYARLLGAMGTLAYLQGDYTDALALFEESCELKKNLGDIAGYSTNLNGAGLVWRCLGQYAKAIAIFEESLAIKRELGDRLGSATALNNLGLVALAQGATADARRYHQASFDIRQEFGDRQGLIHSLNNLGETALLEDKPAEAAALFGRALELSREPDDKQATAYALAGLGSVAQLENKLEEAFEFQTQALQYRYEIGDRRGLTRSLLSIASLLVNTKPPNLSGAVRLLAATERLVKEMVCQLDPADAQLLESLTQTAQTTLAETDFQAARWQGLSSDLALILEPYLAN